MRFEEVSDSAEKRLLSAAWDGILRFSDGFLGWSSEIRQLNCELAQRMPTIFNTFNISDIFRSSRDGGGDASQGQPAWELRIGLGGLAVCSALLFVIYKWRVSIIVKRLMMTNHSGRGSHLYEKKNE